MKKFARALEYLVSDVRGMRKRAEDEQLPGGVSNFVDQLNKDMPRIKAEMTFEGLLKNLARARENEKKMDEANGTAELESFTNNSGKIDKAMAEADRADFIKKLKAAGKDFLRRYGDAKEQYELGQRYAERADALAQMEDKAPAEAPKSETKSETKSAPEKEPWLTPGMKKALGIGGGIAAVGGAGYGVYKAMQRRKKKQQQGKK